MSARIRQDPSGVPLKGLIGALFYVALVSVALPVFAFGQASDRCPDEEWSKWYPTNAGLHFNFKTCMRGTIEQFEWNWSNFSNVGVSLAYRIFSRGVDNCTAPVHEAVGSGPVTVPAHTRLDVPGGGSAEPGRHGRVYLCISSDWQFATQRAFDSLETGTRIRLLRISEPTEELVGSVTSIAPNAVRFAAPATGGSLADSVHLVRFDEISELAISRGIQSRATAGLLTGGIVGVLGGAVVGALTSGYECELTVHPDLVANNRPAVFRTCTGALPGTRAAIVGLVSGVLGGALGHLIGSKIYRENWTTAGPTWTLVRF